MDIRSLLCVTASSIAESFSRGPLRFRTFSRMFSYPKIKVESMVSTKWQQYWFGKPIYEPSNTLSWVCKCNSGSKKKGRTEVWWKNIKPWHYWSVAYEDQYPCRSISSVRRTLVFQAVTCPLAVRRRFPPGSHSCWWYTPWKMEADIALHQAWTKAR